MIEPNGQEVSTPRAGDTIRADDVDPRSAAAELEQQIQDFVRERPVTAVLAALGVGFVVARMFSRR